MANSDTQNSLGTDGINKELESFLLSEGYTDLKIIDNNICGIYPFAFTHGLMVGLTHIGYKGRYCYSNRMDAKYALFRYDNLSKDPIGPWIKYKGEGGERSNMFINKDKQEFENLKPGDTVIRLISGIIPMELTVDKIENRIIYCNSYLFNQDTGAEIDKDLGWDGITQTGSCLKLKK